MRNSGVNFNTILPRDEKMNSVNMTPSNGMVNFEFSMPKISRALLPFNKMLSRKPIDNINKAHTHDSV